MRYVEVTAKDHYEAGFRLGRQTARLQRAFLREFPVPGDWDLLIGKSLPFLKATRHVFPQYVEEVRGLAHGASIPFDKLWVLQCLDELEQKNYVERCSSVFIKGADGNYTVGHNEDWDTWTKPYYFIQKRTVDRKTVLELGMPCAVSGGTVSINSYGIVQTINTLYHTDFQVGIPRIIVARWLTSRKTIEEVKQTFPGLRRAAGYCFNICDGKRLLSIESSAKRHTFFETDENYVHTNHYVGGLRSVEAEHDKFAPSYLRYDNILKRIPSIKTPEDLRALLLSRTEDDDSIYRRTETDVTVASLLIETGRGICQVTQENNGLETVWDTIPIDFLGNK